jgi:hypothetical protein
MKAKIVPTIRRPVGEFRNAQIIANQLPATIGAVLSTSFSLKRFTKIQFNITSA